MVFAGHAVLGTGSERYHPTPTYYRYHRQDIDGDRGCESGSDRRKHYMDEIQAPGEVGYMHRGRKEKEARVCNMNTPGFFLSSLVRSFNPS